MKSTVNGLDKWGLKDQNTDVVCQQIDSSWKVSLKECSSLSG